MSPYLGQSKPLQSQHGSQQLLGDSDEQSLAEFESCIDHRELSGSPLTTRKSSTLR